ncbi:MAG TPA: PspA/IM30 family protein [Chloroflexota bacterium]|nr:PspA/IM30 family protein [Chloroflexota bacterium]
MGLLERVRDIVRANVSDVMNRAEDPEKALDQMVADLNENLVKVRQAAALAIAAQNRLQAEYDQRSKAVQDWQHRAELAVDRGDDDLARQALTRKLQYQNEADQLRGSVQAQSVRLDELRSHVQDLESRIQQAIAQRNQLVARYHTAQASQQLEQELSKTGNVNTVLGRLESKTVDAEAQAAAYHELSRDSLEDRFAQLEQGTSVDDELAALKKDRLLGPGQQSG